VFNDGKAYPRGHQKIKKSVVGIAGLGASVSHRDSTRRVGVGRLILVDFDVVEPSNLNRQQYFVNQIACKGGSPPENIAAINPM